MVFATVASRGGVSPSQARQTMMDASKDQNLTQSATAVEQVLLPRYITRQQDGVFVVLQSYDSASHFASFLDRIFCANMRFVNLQYASMCNLLYNWTLPDIYKHARDLESAGKEPILRLASDIVPFSAQRQKYYRNPRLIEGGDAAEYAFGPIFAEDDDEDSGSKTVRLDVDEFIAMLWSKSVRFGINTQLVQEAFLREQNELAVVARMRGATEGNDATIEELIDSLHRSNAPKLLPDGRVDLRQFQNRFPQMDKNTKLVKKVPRVPGKSGWSLTGKEITPKQPKDFDIATLSGPGTRVERNNLGEFIVADMEGFLQIDAHSHQFSIANKIINHEGVSQRTTGNLVIRAEEYEEHGVVEEHAQVEGKHMTFMEAVFGDLISRGGRVILNENLSGGSIVNPNGVITVEGKASRSSLEAVGGTIVLQYAENCRIVGAKVSIDKAVHCDVLAQNLFIDVSEGCTLAAPKIQIGNTNSRHEVETTIAIMVPDVAAAVKEMEELQRQLDDCEGALSAKKTEMEALSEQQDIKTYQLLNAKLRANEVNMTREQEANWQKLIGRVTPMLKRLKSMSDAMREINGVRQGLSKRLAAIQRETEKASLDISCNIGTVHGDTIIRTMIMHPDRMALETLPTRELHARLRESSADSETLFNDDSGEFHWKWSPVDESNAEA
jgi:uncharacterized protein (DUF342 family)